MPGHAQEDALGTLRWGLRHHIRLFVCCVLIVPLALLAFLAFRPVESQATALVVAQRLDMDLVALPRLGEAVFDNGAIAQQINATFGPSGDIQDIIPDRVSLLSEQDSIVFAVTGHDPSPTTAAAMANLAAETFTKQLNAPGEGVGLFALQSPAAPSAQTAVQQTPGLLILLPVAVVTGALFGIAVVTGVSVIRRPVLDADGAVDATGVPALGCVALPRIRGNRDPDLSEIPGIVPLCRRLLAAGVHTVVLVGPAGTAGPRRQLIVAMTEVLNRVGRVRPVVDGDVARAARAHAGDDSSPASSTGERTNDRAELVLRDGSMPLDPLQLTSGTLTVLVVVRGTSTARVRDAAVEHLGGTDGERVLLVQERRPDRGPRRRASAYGATAGGEVGDEAHRPAPDRVSVDS